MTTLDLDFVRAQFPAFAHPEMGQWAHRECRRQLLPEPGRRSPRHLFAHAKCQPNRDFGPSALPPRRWIAGGGDGLARRRREIHFGPSTSQNTYVLAKAMRPMWDDGDESSPPGRITRPIRGTETSRRYGHRQKEWAVDLETGLLDTADLDELITGSNPPPCCHPCAEHRRHHQPGPSCRSRTAVGGHIVVDGVSYVPNGLPDVAALDCDVYLYSTQDVRTSRWTRTPDVRCSSR